MQESTKVLIIAICVFFLILPVAYYVKGNVLDQPAPQPVITSEYPISGCPVVGPSWEQSTPQPEAVIVPVPTPEPPKIEVISDDDTVPPPEKRGIFRRKSIPTPTPGKRPVFSRQVPWDN